MGLDCLVGIDVGTTSTRVAIYGVDGTLYSAGHSTHEASHPKPGWAEQDAHLWWRNLCQASLSAFSRFKLPRNSIKAISVTSMRQTFVGLDRKRRPQGPAILWYDLRHQNQLEWVREHIGAETVYSRTGSPPGRRSLYKMMWLKENQPDVYQEIDQFAYIPDYLQYQLTGVLVTTPGVSFASGCLNVSDPSNWADDIIQACNLDPEKMIRPVLPPGSIVGYVHTIAAEATGFPAGIPVILAAGDQACGNLGIGVCQLGSLGINGGTSCALQTPAKELPLDPAMNYFIDYSPAGYYVAENGITSGTAALTEWFRDHFAQQELSVASSEDHIWESIYQLAGQVPPGNRGLILVPFLRGANGPYWNPNARGILVGLTAEHGRGHLMRALFEGLAYESRRILESMESGTGVPIQSVRTYGGAARSDLWNQIFADVLGRPVAVTVDIHPVSLGAAISAGYGIGHYQDPISAAESMVRVARTYDPNPTSAQLYQQLYSDVYLNIYQRMADLTDSIARITSTPVSDFQTALLKQGESER